MKTSRRFFIIRSFSVTRAAGLFGILNEGITWELITGTDNIYRIRRTLDSNKLRETIIKVKGIIIE
jgi:hypothetical protein